ncbi:hypothetical protein IEQ34_010423 [Dendrobium chrysotoxum]|uniref:Uncharacterized protein n=1 Tax=Dendrobium chrysotoxum TaxID=161865 RepID=A0AAV7H5L5_DENCH|nr:hypothetical protein IEQ34_010423 [Dendrobium chrysotoxum]
MGLLDKLWDDTLAGPRPEKGLGRLRKPNPLCFRSNYGKGGFWTAEDEMVDSGISKDFGYDSQENALRVTRSIMIKRPSGCPSPLSGTPSPSPSPSPSPAESTSPLSPASGGKEWNPFRRNSSSDASQGALGKSNASPYQIISPLIGDVYALSYVLFWGCVFRRIEMHLFVRFELRMKREVRRDKKRKHDGNSWENIQKRFDNGWRSNNNKWTGESLTIFEDLKAANEHAKV